MYRAAKARKRSARASRRVRMIVWARSKVRWRCTSAPRFHRARACHSRCAMVMVSLSGVPPLIQRRASPRTEPQNASGQFGKRGINHARHRVTHADQLDFIEPVLIAAGLVYVNVTIRVDPDPAAPADDLRVGLGILGDGGDVSRRGAPPAAPPAPPINHHKPPT